MNLASFAADRAMANPSDARASNVSSKSLLVFGSLLLPLLETAVIAGRQRLSWKCVSVFQRFLFLMSGLRRKTPGWDITSFSDVVSKIPVEIDSYSISRTPAAVVGAMIMSDDGVMMLALTVMMA